MENIGSLLSKHARTDRARKDMRHIENAQFRLAASPFERMAQARSLRSSLSILEAGYSATAPGDVRATQHEAARLHQ